jgi:hypothetical protein
VFAESKTKAGIKALLAVSLMNLDSSDVYHSLTVEGDYEYNVFVQHTDGIFCQAVIIVMVTLCLLLNQLFVRLKLSTSWNYSSRSFKHSTGLLQHVIEI